MTIIFHKQSNEVAQHPINRVKEISMYVIPFNKQPSTNKIFKSGVIMGCQQTKFKQYLR